MYHKDVNRAERFVQNGGFIVKEDKDNVIYLFKKRPPLSLDEFKDGLFDSINESKFLPVSDIKVFDRENRIEVTLLNQETYEILIRKKKEPNNKE